MRKKIIEVAGTIPVTKENQEGVQYFYFFQNGQKGKVHRNGQTKYWKTRPTEFRIPFKYGMYDYGYITEKNCMNFTID